jgi:nitroreductase
MRFKLILLTLLSIKAIVIILFMTYFKPFRKNEQVVLNAIHARASVRSYTDKPVPEAKIEKLLKAAMAAPSSRNVQPWRFYVVTDRNILDSLAEGLPFAKMLDHAPLAIIVAGDTTAGNPEGEQIHNWVMDCSAASQNLLLAAHALGLGAVWTGVYPYQARIDNVRAILNIPEHIIPLNVIPIGYPEGEHIPKDKWDEGKVHHK